MVPQKTIIYQQKTTWSPPEFFILNYRLIQVLKLLHEEFNQLCIDLVSRIIIKEKSQRIYQSFRGQRSTPIFIFEYNMLIGLFDLFIRKNIYTFIPQTLNPIA